MEMGHHLSKMDIDLPKQKLWSFIPMHVWRLVFMYVTVKDAFSCCCVCRAWRTCIEQMDERFWFNLAVQEWGTSAHGNSYRSGNPRFFGRPWKSLCIDGNSRNRLVWSLYLLQKRGGYVCDVFSLRSPDLLAVAACLNTAGNKEFHDHRCLRVAAQWFRGSGVHRFQIRVVECDKNNAVNVGVAGPLAANDARYGFVL
jgi:hypothetical protein